MTKGKVVEFRKKKLIERDKRLERQKGRSKARGEKVRTIRLKKWTELAARKRIEEQLDKTRLSKERRGKAENVIENAKTAIRTVEKEREAKYFYCAIPFSEEKSFGNIGMNNNEVYTVTYRDIAAVVSDSPMKNYEMTEDNMRRHDVVLRRVMKEHTVAPVEFGTTIKNERILRRLLKKAHSPIKECLRLVDNMVELGVKAILNEETVFVDHKKRKECVSDILGSLNTGAKQTITGDLFSDRLLLNASYLVKKEDVNEFSNKVRNLKEKYSMLKLLYSGPWAPFNFVFIKIGAEGMEITKKQVK